MRFHLHMHAAPQSSETREGAPGRIHCRPSDLPPAANFHPFAVSPDRVFCWHMKTAQNQNKKRQGKFSAKDLKKLVVRPLTRRIKAHELAGQKLARRAWKKLRSIEESIDIIAREIKRQVDLKQ